MAGEGTRRPWAAAAGAVGAAALAAAAAASSLQGCVLITISHCPEQRIAHGLVRGTWQHDAAVVDCDSNYEYLGGEIVCDKLAPSCEWHEGHKVCHARIGLFQRPRGGGPVPSEGPQPLAGAGCTHRGEAAGPATGAEVWARSFFRHWNERNATSLGGSFAPGTGGLGPELAAALPRANFDVGAVHACDGGRSVVVELRVALGNASNRSLKVTELMDFDGEGRVTARTRATLARTVEKVENSNSQGSLKVTGLPPNGNDLYLYKVFAPFGAIQSVKADLAEDGTCTGVGVVVFAHASDAQNARRKLDGHAPDSVESIRTLPSNAGVVLQVAIETPGAVKEESE